MLLPKTVSAGGTQIKNDGFMGRYLCFDPHEATIFDEMFKAVQEAKMRRSNVPEFDLPYRGFSNYTAVMDENVCKPLHRNGLTEIVVLHTCSIL